MAIESADTGDGGEVTFVNGQAVEQRTEGESHEGTEHGDELAAAKAAVKKALTEAAKEEGRSAAKEAKAHKEKDPLVPRDPDGKFQSDKDPVEGEREAAVKALKKDAEDDASALRKTLDARKEAAKLKREAAVELEKEREEVRRVYQQVQRQEAANRAEAERIASYRKDPMRLVREAGYANPEDYILELAQEGTPEGQAKRANRELLERLERAENWQKQQVEQAQRQAAQQQEQAVRQYRENVERSFLAEASKHETLVGMYKGHEIELIGQADIVAEKYRNATGQEATFAEIAEYLAERHERWYKSRSSNNQATGLAAASSERGSAVNAEGRPTQGSATGKKRPTNAAGSERRSLGTSLADLDGEERLEAAKTAVRAAIHASGER